MFSKVDKYKNNYDEYIAQKNKFEQLKDKMDNNTKELSLEIYSFITDLGFYPCDFGKEIDGNIISIHFNLSSYLSQGRELTSDIIFKINKFIGHSATVKAENDTIYLIYNLKEGD